MVVEENRIRKRLTVNLQYYEDDPFELLVDLPGEGIRNARFESNADLEMFGLSEEEIKLVQDCRNLHNDLKNSKGDKNYEDAKKKAYWKALTDKAKIILAAQLDIVETPTPGTPAKETTAHDQQSSQQIVKKVNTELQSDKEPYEIFDILDNDQIIKYLETSLEQEYFYQFDMDGRQVTGISYAGTIAVARAISADNISKGYKGIEVLQGIKFYENEDVVGAEVSAVDHKTGFIVSGYAEMSKMLKIWSKSANEYITKENRFARTIAVGKATRNALRHLIPEKEILTLYKEWQQYKGH